MNEQNPYDALLASPQQAVRTSVMSAVDKAPDVEAKLQALSRQTGVPVDAIRINPKPVEQRARTEAFDYDELLRKTPATAAHLSDPQKAAISHDDIDNMSSIERALRFVGGSMAAGVQRSGAGVWGAARSAFDTVAPALDFAVGTILPENPLRRVAAGFQRNQEAADAAAKFNAPKVDGVLQAGLSSGLGSLASNTANLPLLFAGPGGVQAYLTAMTLPVFGEGYTKGKAAGMGTLPSVGLGASQAVIEYATEKLPALWLLKDLKAGAGIAKVLGHQALREIPGEQAATILQDLNEWAVLNPAKPFKDYLSERPSAAAQTLIATLVGTGGQVSLLKGFEAVAGRVSGQQAAQTAEDRAKLFTELDALAKASKVRERDASSFEAFIKSASEDGPVANVYVDAKVLAQSGIADQLAQASPAVREQLAVALATGADVRIPLEDYVTNIAGTTLSQGLIEHLKTDPGGMTKREADEAIKGQVDKLRAEFDQQLAQTATDVARREAADQVRETIKAQLEQAGRFRSDINEAYASMVAAFYNTTGARLGLSAAELHARYPLAVRAESPLAGGAVLDQISVQQEKEARTLEAEARAITKAMRERTANARARGVEQLSEADLVAHRADADRVHALMTQVEALRRPPVRERKPPAIEWLTAATPQQRETVQQFPEWTGAGGFSLRPPQESLHNSAQASFTDYEVLPGVREVPLASLGSLGGYDDSKEKKRIDSLASQLKEGKEIEPVFVGVDTNGEAWLIEGQHRARAFKALGLTSIPARVVVDFSGSTLNQSPLAPTITIDGKERPTTNSKGQPIASSEEGVRAFWRWFGDSRVVDEQGRPLVVYHGTMTPGFSSFDNGKVRALSSADAQGFYFTDSPDYAGDYGTTLMPVYLSLQNPSVVPAGEFDHTYISPGRRASLESQGFDGVLAPEVPGGRFGEIVVFSPEQIKSATGNRGTFDPQSANILEQPAYHGSPHRFDKFSTDHMGTGEGAQAYGWGLYFAGKREVAEYYREQLSRNRDTFKNYWTIDGKEVDTAGAVWRDNWETIQKIASKGYAAALADAEQKVAERKAKFPAGSALVRAAENTVKRVKSFHGQEIKHVSETTPWESGQVYEVDIPEDSDMLDWDKPLSAQPEKVREAVLAFAKREGDPANLQRYFNPKNPNGGPTGQDAYAGISDALGSDKAASEYLASLGIKGIKYLDGQSRDDGQGSHNYVIFSGDDVAIRQQFYQGSGARGTYSPEQRTITLLKGADLSTFLHESGHHFLEIQLDIAAQLAAKDPATLAPGEQEIARDTSALLQWFGVSSIAEWHGLDFEEKRSYHERFARGFEAYLVDGQSPSLELNKVFQRFRAWLLTVYKDIKRLVEKGGTYRDATGKVLDVKLSPEVRQVFDRMLATNEEIMQAEQGRSMLPVFESAADAGMTVEQWAEYQALGNEATQEAVHDLETRGVRDMQWLQNARSRKLKELQAQADALRAEERAAVRAEVLRRPVYRAWAFLTGKPGDPTAEQQAYASALATWKADRTAHEQGAAQQVRDALLAANPDAKGIAKGQLLAKGKKQMALDVQQAMLAWDKEHPRPQPPAKPAEGSTGNGVEFGRLDENYVSPEHLAALRARGMVAKQGAAPDMLSEEFGFTSGDEMTQALAEAAPPEQVVEDLTDIAMLEKHGELSSPEAIARAADRALHNDARARFVATEMQALEAATGKPKTMAKAARQFAEALVGRQKVRDVRPSLYANASARASKSAAKALKAGDMPLAAAEKRNQLVNTYAAKEAHKVLDEIDALRKYLAKFSEEGKRGAVHIDYLDQIDALLDRFDLRKSTTGKSIEQRKSLADWVAAQEELGIDLESTLPAKVKLESWRESYKELTVEELRGLADTVRTIEHLGRLKEKMLTALDNRRFADIVREVVDSINANAEGQHQDNRTRDTLGSRASRLFKGFVAAHRKTASLARQLDGFKDAGPMWRYFIAAMNRAGDKEASMRAEITTKLAEIVKPVLDQGKISGKGKFYPTLGLSLNRSEVLAIMLNLGNAGNQQRLLDGRGWTMDRVQPLIDSLSATEVQFVQQVWDLFEAYRPQVAAKERRVMGKEPEWVEALPLETPHGTLRGGYYPIVYDPGESAKSEQFADAQAAQRALRGAFTASTTNRGHLKGRAEKVNGRPLLLTWDAMFRGFNDMVHDLAWHEWVIDANRLMRNDAVAEAIRERHGAAVASQFKSAIKDIAAGEQSDEAKLAPTMRYLRSGAAVAGLGFNLMNAMLQPLGLTQSMVRIGPKWVAKGIAAWAGSPVGLVKDVHERSEFMRNRARTQQREVNEIQSVVRGQSSARQKINALMFLPMQSLQLIADMPTWWGAYQKALTMTDSEQEAVQLADQAVIDAQAGGQVKDLAAIQRGGEMQKLFTVFYGFFSSSYNLGVERAKATNYRSPLEVMHLAGDFLLLYSVPAVMAALLKEALQPGGNDDPEKLARKLISEQISYLMGLLVGVREVTGAVQYATGTKMMDTAYGGPAGLRFFQELDKLGKQVGQGDLDRALARAMVNVGGVLLHLPASQANRTIDGIVALSEGKTENPGAVLFGYDKGN